MAFGILLLGVLFSIVTASTAFAAGYANLLTVFGIYVGMGLLSMVVGCSIALIAGQDEEDFGIAPDQSEHD